MSRRTRIKICGLREPADAAVAAEAGADAVGLVFVPETSRQVSEAEASAVVAALPAFVSAVGVFVDAEAGWIREVAGRVGLDTVQLHGEESPEMLGQLSPLRVIRAVPFRSAGAVGAVRPWLDQHAVSGNLAGVLFDTPAPAGEGSQTGGHGKAFDWRDLAQVLAGELATMPVPVILAGGLTEQNVGEAIETVRPYAVDVSSGVEASRGVKDRQRIRAFCAAVR